MTSDTVSRQLDAPRQKVGSDAPFFAGMVGIGGIYLLLIVGMLAAMWKFSTLGAFVQALRSEEIRYSIRLSLLSCFLTTILSLWVAVPIGYLMSRYEAPQPKSWRDYRRLPLKVL
jgi:molybdate transport system permease protein